MKYQVSIVLKIQGSYSMRKFLKDNGFRIFLKDGVTDNIKAISDNLNTADNPEYTSEGPRYFLKCIYNGENGFPPQEVFQRVSAFAGTKSYDIRYLGE